MNAKSDQRKDFEREVDERLKMLTTQFPTKASAQTPQEDPIEEGVQIPEQIREAIKQGDNVKLNEMLKGMSLDQVRHGNKQATRKTTTTTRMKKPNRSTQY